VKKFVAILFLVIYGFGTIGATVHTHYCMGEYVGASLLQSKNSKCGKCGMKEDSKKKGCCQDEQKEFKLKIDQKKSSILDFIYAKSAPFLLVHTPDYHFELLQQKSLFIITNLSPPPLIQKERLHVLYGVFLI
jgi:hypothetical protein